jgi:hypothetical protein
VAQAEAPEAARQEEAELAVAAEWAPAAQDRAQAPWVAAAFAVKADQIRVGKAITAAAFPEVDRAWEVALKEWARTRTLGQAEPASKTLGAPRRSPPGRSSVLVRNELRSVPCL